MTAFVAFGTAVDADNASLTLGLAAGIAAGDISYAVVGGKSSAGTWSAPAGWDEVFSDQSPTAGCAMSVFARRWESGDGSALFTWAGGVAGNTTIGQTFAVRGVPTSVPLADTMADWTLIVESAAAGTTAVHPSVDYATPDVWIGAGFWGDDVADSGVGSSPIQFSPGAGQFTTRASSANNSTVGTDAALPIGVASHGSNVTSANFTVTVVRASGGGTFPVYAFAFRLSDKVYAGRSDEADAAYALSGLQRPTIAAFEVDAALALGALVVPAFHLGGLGEAYEMAAVSVVGAQQHVLATVAGVAVGIHRVTLRTESTLLMIGLDAVTTELSEDDIGQAMVVSLVYTFPDATSSSTVVFSGTVDTVRAYERGLSQVTASGVLSPHPPATITPVGKQYLAPGRVRAAADFYAQPGDTLDDGTLIGSVVTVAQAGRSWFTEYVNG